MNNGMHTGDQRKEGAPPGPQVPAGASRPPQANTPGATAVPAGAETLVGSPPSPPGRRPAPALNADSKDADDTVVSLWVHEFL